jgi:hypothetical protein
VLEGLLWVDAVEKGICGNLEATLIQDWKPMRNLDSKSHLSGFVCFKVQFHISFTETFSTASVKVGNSLTEHIESASPLTSGHEADIASGPRWAHFRT